MNNKVGSNFINAYPSSLSVGCETKCCYTCAVDESITKLVIIFRARLTLSCFLLICCSIPFASFQGRFDIFLIWNVTGCFLFLWILRVFLCSFPWHKQKTKAQMMQNSQLWREDAKTVFACCKRMRIFSLTIFGLPNSTKWLRWGCHRFGWLLPWMWSLTNKSNG